MTDIRTYKLNHSMIRVTNPVASLQFYKLLGMSVLQEFKLPDFGLDLYFLAYDAPGSTYHSRHMSDRQGVLELSYNYDVKATHNGNTDPKGFGYISISVDYLTAACQRLSDAGFQSLQSPTKGSAIVLDPDAYWIKISAMPSADNTANSQSSTITKTCPKSYKFRSTMLRIKNKDISLKFYTEVMGMKHVDTTEHQEDGFTSYFLSYNGTESDASLANEGSSAAKHEEMLELAWYYETEKIPDMRYHSGNTSPEGFGHICVSVDDITAACERFEHLGVSWQKRLMDGPFRIGFIFDPDGYYIEIIQNEQFKPANHDV